MIIKLIIMNTCALAVTGLKPKLIRIKLFTRQMIKNGQAEKLNGVIMLFNRLTSRRT